ncbi:LOW QUALITY PROTEIN: 36.4 kDa proline-rich protein [Arachis ipaensis]|uniref:LOW QUALITY PROTEIN: 36.4 kDa proline-rich protein n=1 Tax=Arachis ipaensis TaxID=130454 RepID=UPI000A2B605A|nr:LOW QUALITY PROTEIN: 36.4 kDa proline-rich protein [Arachis ipaensis]
MESSRSSPSKIYASFFICILFISSLTPTLACGYCGNNPPKKHNPNKKPKTPVIVKPPGGILPPGILPPGIVPPIVNPPVIVPPVTVPPVTVPPVTVPGVTNPPSTGGGGKKQPCPSPKTPAQATCPIDTLKLGACVDLLGGLVHVGVGDPAVNQCCPVLQGLVELEAAACLCTTLKVKLLNLNIYVPLALQLLVACGKTPPPGTPAPCNSSQWRSYLGHGMYVWLKLT